MIELENFGWNLLTVSFSATIFFVLLGCWGLWQQNKYIWIKRSGKSLSTTWFICSLYLFISSFIYGLSINSLALIIVGVMRGLFHVPILAGLWRFKGFTRKQWLTLLILAVVAVVMIISPKDMKGVFYMLFSAGVLIPTSMQPIKIWKNKNPGVVSIELLIIYSMSSMFWVIYASIIGKLPIIMFSTANSMIFASTITLWFKYRNKKTLKTKYA